MGVLPCLRRAAPLGAASAFAIVLAVAPVALNLDTIALDAKAAFAKGGGNGGGGGNGNGNGNADAAGASDAGGKGGKSGKDSSQSAESDSHGKSGGGHAMGQGLGHAKGDDASEPGHAGSKRGISASALGGLNAAHASQNALAHAAPNSQVGLIAAYRDAIAQDEPDIEAAAAALAAVANKSINTAVVEAVNDLLGVDVDPAVSESVAAEAAAQQ